jgi:hypothetical protein
MMMLLGIPTETIEVVAAVIAAIAAVAGLAAVFTRFKPRFDAKIDKRRQAIRLEVVNKGRRDGRISNVSVIEPQGTEVPSKFAGLSKSKFHSASLSKGDLWALVIEAEKGSPFAKDIRIFVKWGWGRWRRKELTPEPADTSYHGTESDWPEAS